ncbi:MAG: ABC transporter ATP-binding protein [Bacteroidales bacterium]|nr:ABC transporter ATP-binding protein [Bacteroidales bacterium]
MIKVQNIHKTYENLEVLKGINLEIKKGEVVSVVGASGAGKTTLLNIIGTLDKCDSGIVEINNIQVNKFNDKKLSEFRNKNIGFVFQFHHLLPEFTALENVMIPAFICNTNKKEAEEKARKLFDFLNIGNKTENKPSQLSGGEQQRVAVARALINNPLIVLADEPSGNLDSVNAKELHSLFFKLREQYNQTFLIATHNSDFADMADRKLTIKDGMIL